MALEGAMEEEVSGAGEGCLTQVVARVPAMSCSSVISIREERCWHQGKGSAK
ncbi:hypothetical protein NC652_040741 [Populus alba x Populus x berolinensis]|uniref:Uncharacterized protein n=1 Tax=Populus alba x Populus x berolinensis TaxID=444605 RepID=A0AAD6L796_9ROSI|nr:hypothetical protein NC652_040741 [Populus alba x Populus x berolinensis]KAJ6951629.1 hypothetical protein NC653_040925 [Populus alba x Populus x berolinensis]